ncbi:MAG: hypothetical protein IJX25_02470 [Clostridia bacterium]|nr:hypothetical protein [Clostridia bacterium]MBQ8793038.1 hypothetical protein [Clostridia bacterium]
MIADFKDKFKILFEKIKKIKHFYIYLAVIIAIIFVGIYYLTLPKSEEDGQASTIDNNLTEFSSSAEYVEYLENKLENVISSLKGVGDVEVVITIEKGFEYVYQTEEETRTTSNGTSITTTTVVLVDGKPVLLEEIYPTIKGIVVVAKGSADVAVKMDILYLIQTVVDVGTSQINIMEGK